MSRRKQSKPMHILNEGSEATEDVPVNKETKDGSDEEKTSNLPLCGSSSSILSDFSRLIPDENDQESSTNEKPVSFNLHETEYSIPNLRSRGRSYNCHFCSKVFKTPADLERHLRVHTGEKPYICKICSKPFKVKRSLQGHEFIVHGVQTNLSPSILDSLMARKRRLQIMGLPDNIPPRRGRPPKFLKYTVTTPETVAAKLSLGKKRGRKPNSEKQTTSKENNIKNEHEVKMEDSSKNCDDNGSVNTDEKEVKTNLALNVEENVDSETDENSENNQISPLKHSLATRTCKFCGKVCIKPSDLTRHLMKHTGEQPFQCDVCKRKFKAKRSLQYHQKSAHGAIIKLSQALEDKLSQSKRLRLTTIKIDGSVNPSSTNLPNHSSSEPSIEEIRETSNNSPGVSSVPGVGEIGKDLHNTISPDVEIKQEDDTDPEDSNFKEDNFNNSSIKSELQEEELLNENKIPEANLPNLLGRYKINFKSETIIATQLEGTNLVNGQKIILYKCFICKKIMPLVRWLKDHLTLHFNLDSPVFQDNFEDLNNSITTIENSLNSDNIKDTSIASPPISVSEKSEKKLSALESQLLTAPLNATSFYSFVPCIPTSTPITSSEMAFSTSSSSGISSNLDSDSKVTLKYKCNYCGKFFHRPFSLQRHERIHTGVKPCYCKECGRGFSEPRNLRHHIIRFHSDGNQREFLKRNNKLPLLSNKLILTKPYVDGWSSVTIFQDAKAIAPSVRRISVMKKAAVRLLNSSTRNSPTDDECGTSKDRENESSASLCSNTASEDNQDLTENTSEVTVVFPNDESKDSNSHINSCRLHSYWGEYENMNHESEDLEDQKTSDNCEILRDPKQSLMSWRQNPRTKHRQVCDRESSVSVHADEQFNDCPQNDSEISPCNDDSKKEILPLSVELQEYAAGENSASGHSSENNESVQVIRQLKNYDTQHRRSRFFSSYLPRLNVVDTPVKRSEACKPKVLDNGKVMYPCSYCDKIFFTLSDLNRHMDFHEDIRPFKCRYCDYYSRTKSQLKVHVMRHQGIKQYLCEICNYNGVTQSDLNRHRKTQTHCIRARNICIHCNLGFFNRIQLSQHLQAFHNATNFDIDGTDLVSPEDCFNFIMNQDGGLSQASDDSFSQDTIVKEKESDEVSDQTKINTPDENDKC